MKYGAAECWTWQRTSINKGATGDDSYGQAEFPKGHVDLREIAKRALEKP